MAVIGVKSITGITSITNAAGGADVLTFHSNNTTERLRITSDGEIRCTGAADNKGFAVWIDGTRRVAEIIEHSSDGEIRLYTGESTPVLRTVLTSYGDSYINAASTGKVGVGLTNPSNALDVQGGTTNTAIVARSTDAKAQVSLVDNATTGVGCVAIGAEGDNLFLTSGSGGAEALRITSSGSIGIGTDSPGTRDTSGSVDIIQNHANTGPHFRVLNKHATLGGGIQFKNNNQRGGIEFLNKDGTNNGYLYHSTGGWTWGETLQLASGKLLRIGKTSGSFALDVQTASDSTFRITNSGETGHGSHDAKIVAGGSYYQNPNIVGSVIKFSTYNGSSEGERARITSGGLFLLGSPTSDLSGNHKFISVGSRHAFQYGASAGTYLSFIMGSAGGDVTIDSNARSGDYPPLHFNLGGSTKVAIDKDGHFGIGRSTGLELLDVKGGNDDAIKFSASAYGGGHLKITGADTDIGGTGSAYKATYRIKTKTQNSNSGNGAERDALVFYHDGWSGSAGHISVFPNSKLGIGTDNPTYQLHVDSADAAIGKWKSRRSSGSYIEYSLGADGAQLGFIGSGGQILTGGADSSDFAIRSQGDLCFSSGGAAERCRIDASGRFLLGVTTQSISSSQKFEVSGMSYFSNNSTSTGTIYIRNQQDNTADVNSGAGAPFIIYTDGSGNRAGFFMNDSEQMGLSSHGSLMFYQGNTAPANPTKPRGKLDTDGMCHTGFRTVWRRNHSISTSSATYTWDDVFHEVNQADSSFMSQGGVWDLILHSDNYRHMALITASVVIGDIDTYGSSTNSWDWLTSPTTAGVWTAGCAGSPFSSVSSTSFNYTRGACHQSISMTMMKRTFRYNKGLLGTAYHQDT